MTESNEVWKAIAAPFPANEIQWRVGATTQDKARGLAVPYIDARSIEQRLDDAVGPANWYPKFRVIDKTTLCALSVRIDGEWITKEDGAGATEVESEKGALSAALKRAAVQYGIGRYLYYLESEWVDIEAVGKSYKIKGSPPQLPKWALPAEEPVAAQGSEGDTMTEEVQEKFVAALGTLHTEFFDVYDAACAEVGAPPELKNTTSRANANKWYKAIKVMCEAKLAAGTK